MSVLLQKYIPTICLKFQNSNKTNLWHNTDVGNFYVRTQSVHCVESQLLTFFDFANIDIFAKYQHKSIFSTMLNFMEQYENVWVENVLNPGLIPFLIRRGYTQVGRYEPFSFYLIKPS